MYFGLFCFVCLLKRSFGINCAFVQSCQINVLNFQFSSGYVSGKMMNLMPKELAKKPIQCNVTFTYFPCLSILSVLIFWYSRHCFSEFCLARKKLWLTEHKICFYFCFHLNKNLNWIEKKIISYNVRIFCDYIASNETNDEKKQQQLI